MDTVDKKHRDSKSVILTSSYQCCPSRARTQKTEPLSDDQSGQPKCAWRFGFYAWRCFPDLLMVDRLGHVSFSIQRDVNEYKYIIHNEQVTCSNTNAKKAHKASGEQRWSHRTQQQQKKQTNCMSSQIWSLRDQDHSYLYTTPLRLCIKYSIKFKKSEINKKYEIYEQE